MYDLIHQKFPNLEIHASTQLHIHNLDGALVAKKLGFKRTKTLGYGDDCCDFHFYKK
mgnify:CR=1 FL=1